MPIIGATDRASVEARYPLVGRLFKGGPKRKRKRGDKEYLIFGEELSYFRFVSAKAGALDAFTKAFTDKPQSIRAYLPYPDVEKCFSTWIECWSGGGRLLYRSNKKRTVRRWLEDRKAYSDREEDQIDDPGNPDASWVGRLTLFFPELLQAGYPGTVMLTTHGKHDCTRISAALYALENDCRWREKGIAGVEITLSRQEVEHTDPDGAKRKHWDVFVEPSERFVLAALEEARQEADRLLEPGTRLIDAQTGEVVLDTTEEDNEPSAAQVSTQNHPPPKAGAKAEGGNGNQSEKVRAASIKGCSGWRIAANELADGFAYYMGEKGPNFALMLETAGLLGFTQITDENLETVIEALEKHVEQPEPEGAPAQQEIPF